MSLYRQNFGYGTLKNVLTAGATSMTMNAGHNFPLDASKSFKLIIWDHVTYPDPSGDEDLEIVTANWSGSGDVYTISRAEEGTTAVEHAAGQGCAMTITAGSITDPIEPDDIDYVAGSVIEASITAETSYYNIRSQWYPIPSKSLTIGWRKGTVRVGFSVKAVTDDGTAYAAIFKNGVIVSASQRGLSGSYYEFTSDIAVEQGDTIAVYGYLQAGGSTDWIYCNGLYIRVANPTAAGGIL